MRGQCSPRSEKKGTRSKRSLTVATRAGWPQRLAIFCSPWSTSPAISMPTPRGCSVKPISNSSADLRRLNAHWRSGERHRKAQVSLKWMNCGTRPRRPKSNLGIELRPYARRDVGITAHRHRQPSILAHILQEDLRVTIEPAQAGAIGRIYRDLERLTAFAQPRFDSVDELIDPLTGQRRYRYRATIGRLAFRQVKYAASPFTA